MTCAPVPSPWTCLPASTAIERRPGQPEDVETLLVYGTDLHSRRRVLAILDEMGI